jgi:2-polyprenyl-3-methyl-5-hydroxy-6-metoxy-1,4-benzoquinol methylase
VCFVDLTAQLPSIIGFLHHAQPPIHITIRVIALRPNCLSIGSTLGRSSDCYRHFNMQCPTIVHSLDILPVRPTHAQRAMLNSSATWPWLQEPGVVRHPSAELLPSRRHYNSPISMSTGSLTIVKISKRNICPCPSPDKSSTS